VNTLSQPVLDFHARLVPRPGAVDRLLSMMDECGIARAVVCAGGLLPLDLLSRQLVEGGHVEADADNEAVRAAAEASDGRLVPFYFANPHRDPARYREAAGGFAGLEVSPAVHGVPLRDARTEALVAVAGEAGHPVYTVCLSRPGSAVADLVALAVTHPSVTFVLGHSGVGNIDYYALDLIAPHPNILLETSGGYSTVVGTALERLGAHRLLFGTEFPLQHPRVELAKFAALDLAPPDWALVAWHNAHRLLGRHAHRQHGEESPMPTIMETRR
jgi:predicted TIM-barrel fold metal-dependent hydrolase